MRLSPARRELAIDDIHELTDSDLAAVSGGALNAAMAGALAGAAKGAGPRDDGVLPTLPCHFLSTSSAAFFLSTHSRTPHVLPKRTAPARAERSTLASGAYGRGALPAGAGRHRDVVKGGHGHHTPAENSGGL